MFSESSSGNCNGSASDDDDTCKSEAGGDADFPGINSVAVKLPTFWMHDPDLWFLQSEAVFASRVPAVRRDATKFNHVVTALPSEALNAVKNVIRLSPATADRYQQLKSTLITTYGKTCLLYTSPSPRDS